MKGARLSGPEAKAIYSPTEELEHRKSWGKLDKQHALNQGLNRSQFLSHASISQVSSFGGDTAKLVLKVKEAENTCLKKNSGGDSVSSLPQSI